MQSIEGLAHDSASLYRFIQFICRFCEEQPETHTYLDSSRDFLVYVKDLGDATLKYLHKLDAQASAGRRSRELRQKLVAVKLCWTQLHEFVKPAADAHTLRIPVPLLEFLQNRVRAMPRLASARIVILLSPELNYLQHQHGQIKVLTSRLSEIFAAKPLPDGMGFIAIPYSQADGVFTNLLICHELGHFAFEELAVGEELWDDVDVMLNRTIKDFGTASEPAKSWCRRQLADWAEEIFCDIFALRIIGPAFSFAAIELFNLLALLDDKASLEFNESHPADACRFREHLRELRSQGWWPVVSRMRAEHVRLISRLGRFPESNYRFPHDNVKLGRALVNAFLPLRRRIRKLVHDTTGQTETGLREYRKWNRVVQNYLGRGVVPSTLAVAGKRAHPAPCATVNCGFSFYLERLRELMAHTEGCEKEEVEDRARSSGRVEMWTMKAVEDYKLLKADIGGE